MLKRFQNLYNKTGLYDYGLRCMGTISGEVTLSFTDLVPSSSGIYSQRKEFAPLGANSFL